MIKQRKSGSSCLVFSDVQNGGEPLPGAGSTHCTPITAQGPGVGAAEKLISKPNHVNCAGSSRFAGWTGASEVLVMAGHEGPRERLFLWI